MTNKVLDFSAVPIPASEADARLAAPLKRILLLENTQVRSAPTLTLAAELARLGVETVFSDKAESRNTPKWLHLAWRSQAIVFVRYRPQDYEFFQRQLFRARIFGCTVVRWWVGSDVLYCQASDEAANATRTLNEAVDLNIAAAPHLVEELKTIGIHAEYVPSFCDFTTREYEPPPQLPRGILAYLPTHRKAFYGGEILTAMIQAHPDLEFNIVGDESHSLQHYPNVNSLGWVEDMETVWSRVGMLLRVTEHDGLPRMVLDALARGRHVIYSQPFEGCWYGRSEPQVLRHLEQFKLCPVANTAGPQIARSVAENAGPLYTRKIAPLCTPVLSAKRSLNAILSARWMK